MSEEPGTPGGDEALRLERERWQPLLEQVLRLCGSLHPAIRHNLAGEARRLRKAAGITEPIPRIKERRPRALYERERIRRQRERKRRPSSLTIRLRGK
jgi:hypothetical protein